MKTSDQSMAIGKSGFSRAHRGNGNWLEGPVFTRNGIVETYSQGDEHNVNHTRLDFIHGGKLHMRNYNQRFSRRGLAMLAKRFEKEVSTK